MGPDLSLDLNLSSASSSSSAPAAAAAAHLESYIKSLEDEKRKIEAFRRDLPLSTLLLSHVINVLKEELQRCVDDGEEIIALEKDGHGLEKLSWLSSAQLWTNNYTTDTHKSAEGKAGDGDHDVKELRRDEIFLPFNVLLKEEGNPTPESPPPNLALGSMIEFEDFQNSSSPVVAQVPVPVPMSFHDQNQPPRKQRRCWSPELHRHFVFALQKLGGAQVATPKQIRELMKMEGLTNDEVKSHLQKYRLHTRRLPNPSPAVAVSRQIWGKEDRHSRLGSPQGPLQFPRSSLVMSLTAGDSYDEDGRSESFSWK